MLLTKSCIIHILDASGFVVCEVTTIDPSRVAVLLIQTEYSPSVAVRSEHHAAALGDVDDAVLGLDRHPAQLDVLRVGRAHACVLLETEERRSHKCTTHVCVQVNSTRLYVCVVPSGSRPAAR